MIFWIAKLEIKGIPTICKKPLMRSDLRIFQTKCFFCIKRCFWAKKNCTAVKMQFEILLLWHVSYLACSQLQSRVVPVKQCFPTFFGSRHLYLVFKIFGGTPSWFNRYKERSRNCNYWRHPWHQLTTPLCVAAPQLGIIALKHRINLFYVIRFKTSSCFKLDPNFSHYLIEFDLHNQQCQHLNSKPVLTW